MTKDHNHDLSMGAQLEIEGIEAYNPANGNVYHYTNPKACLEILRGNSLLFNTNKALNDPFDLSSHFMDYKPTEEEMKRVFYEKLEGAPRPEKRAAIKRFRNFPNEYIEATKNAHLKYVSEIGICCFSTKNDSVLMWSHYSQKHTGVAIGFGPLMTNNDLAIGHVMYVEKLKRLRVWDFLNNQSGFAQSLFMKAKIWKYEEEVRAICFKKTGLINFNPVLIKEILFGLNADPKIIKDVIKILSDRGYSNVKLYQMIMNTGDFTIKPKYLAGS